MKKKTLCLLLATVMVLSLAGCECNHQWSEADCTAASVCAKCGETQGEALGHEWRKASCLSPETCSRCGATQGEAMAHMYSEWTLGKTDMSRSCELCGETENSAIDYEAFLAQQLPGYWNVTRMLSAYGGSSGPEDLGTDTPDPNIAFFEDGTARILGSDAEITWTLGQAEYDTAASVHMIGIEVQSSDAIGSYSLMCYPAPSSIGDKLVEIPLQSDISKILYTKEQTEMLVDILSGSWCAREEKRVYNLTFGEDHSFSADFDGEVSGYWLPRTFNGVNGEELNILLIYEQYGSHKIVRADPYSPINGNIGSISGYTKDQLALILTDIDYIMLSPGTEEDLKEAESKAYGDLCGLWTSTSTGVISMTEEKYTPTTEFSLTLNEDGSFTALLDREISGSWTFTNTTRYSGMFVHDLLLTSESWGKSVSMSVNPVQAELIIDLGNETERYYFAKMSEEEIAEYKRLMEEAPGMILGKWEGTSGSAEFKEDGSVTIALGSKAEGSWSFREIYFDDIWTSIYYSLDCPGFYQCRLAVRVGSNDDMDIDITTDWPHSNYDLFPSARFAEIQKKMQGLPGRWSGSTMYIHDDSGEIIEELSGEYYLELSENGRFTGSLGKNVSGNWQFSGIDKNDPYFKFSLDGNETSYFYDLVDDVFLVWLYNSEGNQCRFELTK